MRGFGGWLRELRRAADLTQEQLAERVAVDVTTIRKYERGERRPSTPVLTALAAALGVTEDERAAFVAAGRAARPSDPAATPPDADHAANQSSATLPPITFYIVHAPAAPRAPFERSATADPEPGTVELLTDRDLAPIQLLRSSYRAPLIRWPRQLAGLSAAQRQVIIGVTLLLLFVGAMLVSGWYRNRDRAALGEVQLDGSPHDRVQVMTAHGRVRTGGQVRVGEPITVIFTVKNTDDHWVLLKQIVAGSQGPGAKANGWDAPSVDFSPFNEIWLAPGATITYRQAKIFTTPGVYFVEPVIEDALWRWGGIGPFTPTTRVLFEVVP